MKKVDSTYRYREKIRDNEGCETLIDRNNTTVNEVFVARVSYKSYVLGSKVRDCYIFIDMLLYRLLCYLLGIT